MVCNTGFITPSFNLPDLPNGYHGLWLLSGEGVKSKGEIEGDLGCYSPEKYITKIHEPFSFFGKFGLNPSNQSW